MRRHRPASIVPISPNCVQFSSWNQTISRSSDAASIKPVRLSVYCWDIRYFETRRSRFEFRTVSDAPYCFQFTLIKLFVDANLDTFPSSLDCSYKENLRFDYLKHIVISLILEESWLGNGVWVIQCCSTEEHNKHPATTGIFLLTHFVQNAFLKNHSSRWVLCHIG